MIEKLLPDELSPDTVAKERALLPGLKEALLWKPIIPGLETALSYAWQSAIESRIRAIEALPLRPWVPK